MHFIALRYITLRCTTLHYITLHYIIAGSLEVKLPAIWTNEKAEVRRVRKEKKRRRSEERKNQKKEDAGARKGRKSRITAFFP